MRVLFALLLFCALPLWAAIDDAPSFENAAQTARYYAIVKNVRCPTCQNNNIDESNAPLARQLRAIVAEQVRAGKTSAQIRAWLIARYGDFVTYRPPFDARTWVLWLLPAFAMLGALLFWFWRRPRAPLAAVLSAEERQELAQWRREYGEKP